MTNEHLKTMTAELKALSPQEFLECQDSWRSLKYMISSKERDAEDWQKEQDRQRLNKIKQEISFEEPSFERFDEDESDETNAPKQGSANFSSKEQCDEFLKLINKQSYYYLYTIDWQGAGKYVCKTSWDIRCGEVEYTAHFTKVEEK